MKAAGFHWFVAWRYLMARPRRVSPAITAVAGLLFIASTAASIIGGFILGRTHLTPFASHSGYENALIGATLVGALGAVALLLGLVRYCQAEPGRLWVPCTVGVGLLACALGALIATGAGPDTRTIPLWWLALGLPLIAAGVIHLWRRMPRVAAASLVMTGLLGLGSGAAFALARSALAPESGGMTGYPRDAVLLPGLGLWSIGMIGVALVLVHHASRRRVSRAGAWIAAGLLAASAAWPYAAGALPLPDPADPFLAGLSSLDVPASVRYASHLRWGGVGLLALGGIVLLGHLILGRRGHELGRGPLAGRLVATGLLAAGALGVLVARFVLAEPDHVPVLFVSSAGSSQTVLLVAVGLLGLGERAVMLAVVRYFFTFFTTVSIAGVAIGSMALVMVLSVMSGFEADLREKILGSNAHVLITKEEGSFTEYRDVAARIDDLPGVVAHTPYLVSEVVIVANSNYANVIIKGVDPRTIGAVTKLEENLEQPQALERLYPLIDDPEPGQGEPGPGPGDGPGDAAPGRAGEDMDDPPPPDMDVGIGEPEDFSGGADLVDDQAAPVAGGGEDAWDPPPPDLDVGIGEPEDFSGRTGEEAARDLGVLGAGVLGEPWQDALGTTGGAGDLLGDARDEPPAERKRGKAGTGSRISPRVARLPGVLAGKELVKQIHLYVGQEVRIVSPLGEDTPAGPVPRTRFMRVAGTFFTGMYEYDLKFVYVPLETLQSFLDLGDEVTGIEVRVADPERTGPVLESIRAALPPGYRVQDWKELNRSLFSALKLEKIAMFLVLAIIILVASFSIIGNLVMVVIEKAKEIALLKTLGATDMGVVKIFVAQGFFIGLVGTVIGVSYGLVACVLGQVYGLPLDPEVYYIDRLPIDIDPAAVAIIAVAGIVISVVATVYPAIIGARLRPLEGLRYD